MRALATGVGAAIVAVALMVTAASAAVPDAWVTTKAKMALYTTSGVSGNAINVDTVSGVVTLHGKIESAAEKTKAESTVKAIEGVKQVRNLLQVVPAARENAVTATDDQIRDRVKQALKDDDLTGVSVQSVNKGVVLLAGNVDTLSQHLRAIEDTARVPGVQRVASEIKSPDKLADAEIYSEPPAQPAGDAPGKARRSISDMWVTSAVKMRLIADDRTPGLDVNVDTTGGKVTLFGTVPSQTAKAAAEEDAKKVSGVTTVANELEIVPSSQKEAVKEDDGRIKDRVKDALAQQDELRDLSIGVEVENGVARLTGSVPSQEQRIRAAVAARTTPGVRAVRDELRVASK